MKFGTVPLVQFSRLALLVFSLVTCLAHADEYSDVSTLIRSGKLVQAQAMVDRAIASKPRDPQMRFFKGVIQRDSGRLADAINTFTKLTEDYPELPEPYNNLAVIYAGLSQFDKARTALEQAIRTNPSYATAHENLGDVYAKLASQAYNKALQIDASNTAVQPKLALIRELFNPATGKSSRPAPAVTTPPAALAVAPAATVAAPAPASASPAVSAPKIAAQPPASAPEGSNKEVVAAVQAWAKAWSDRNMSAYLSAYGKEFEPPNKQARDAWEEDRRLRITGKSRISVTLLNLNVSVNGAQAVARFQQDYKADALAVLSRKTLELVRTGDRWVIVRESSGG